MSGREPPQNYVGDPCVWLSITGALDTNLHDTINFPRRPGNIHKPSLSIKQLQILHVKYSSWTCMWLVYIMLYLCIVVLSFLFEVQHVCTVIGPYALATRFTLLPFLHYSCLVGARILKWEKNKSCVCRFGMCCISWHVTRKAVIGITGVAFFFGCTLSSLLMQQST